MVGRNRLAPVPRTAASHGERQDNVPQSLQVVFSDAEDAERPVSAASFELRAETGRMNPRRG
jgi:hypothetical protein